MKKCKGILVASLWVVLTGVAVANVENPINTSPAINSPTNPVSSPTNPALTQPGQPAQPIQPGPDASQCALKTDLVADRIKKCTEAMAKNDGAVLKTEGCCQENNGLNTPPKY